MMVIISSSTIIVYGFAKINEKESAIIDLYQLKTDILNANIALRNAAIAPNLAFQENELAKMLVTRSSANKIYDRLSATELTHFQDTILSEMKRERPQYREAQLKVVADVRKNNPEVWENMLYYNTLMDKYLDRCTVFITSIEKNVEFFYSLVKASMLISILVVITIMYILIRKVYAFYQISKYLDKEESKHEYYTES
jgi:hypothetical protein